MLDSLPAVSGIPPSKGGGPGLECSALEIFISGVHSSFGSDEVREPTAVPVTLCQDLGFICPLSIWEVVVVNKAHSCGPDELGTTPGGAGYALIWASVFFFIRSLP